MPEEHSETQVSEPTDGNTTVQPPEPQKLLPAPRPPSPLDNEIQTGRPTQVQIPGRRACLSGRQGLFQRRDGKPQVKKAKQHGGRTKSVWDIIKTGDIREARRVMRLKLKDNDWPVAKFVIEQTVGLPQRRGEFAGPTGRPMKVVLFIPAKGSYQPEKAILNASFEELPDSTEEEEHE